MDGWGISAWRLTPGKDRRDDLDWVRRLNDEAGEKEQRLEAEEDYLRQNEQRLQQAQAEHVELRVDLLALTQHNSALKQDQRLHAKLENLEQVLKHMREVTERRQHLEQEQEQALAILNFKQNEIKRLQRAQFAAKKEQEGVVQILESTLDGMQATVLELEEKCRSQTQQFSLLSHELERFRLQAGDAPDSEFCLLTNGLKEPEFAPHAPGLARPSWPPAPRRRVLPSINLNQGSTASATRFGHHPPASRPLQPHTHKSSPSYEVVAAREDGRAAGKPKVFIVRHSYDPYHGPNHSPEVELPLKAGEYICVSGDMDEDGFYEGELMDGRRGLVPSNFVELVSTDNIVGPPRLPARDLSYNRPQLCPESQERSDPPTPVEAAPGPMTNGLDAEEPAADTVPYPRRLSLIRQLAKSVVIGWDPPLVPAGWGNVWSYNVFVDEELRLNVPFGSQTKAVLERLDVSLKAYRVSVQSVTERGDSDRLSCTFLVGRDVCMAPTRLRVEQVTSGSALLAWLPSNSNYAHTVSLNDGECWLVKPGGYSLSLSDLRPHQLYRAKVEARTQCTPWELSLYGRQHKSSTVTFTTLASGPPAAPLNVQLETGPGPGIALVSWLPVAVDAAGMSNGVPVTGYAIYADKRKVLEVSSSTAGSALMGPAQIQTLWTAQELTVRTMSPQGESTDSVPVPILPNLTAVTVGVTLTRPPGAVSLATGPPLDLSAAKMSTLPHNPPADAPAPLVRTSSGADRVMSADSASALRPQETQNGRCLSGVGVSSELSNLPEEEEGLYSDAQRDEPHESTKEDGKTEPWETDSDEEVLARILRAQVPVNQELFSIPEVTEEEDSCQETEERQLRKSEQEKPAITKSPAPCSTIPNSFALCSTTHLSKTFNDPIYRLPILDSPTHCSTVESSPASQSKTSDDTVHCSPIQNITAHCSTMANSPSHQSKASDNPIYHSTVPVSSTHCSTMGNTPTHQSKTSDDYSSTFLDSAMHCYTTPNSPTHQSKTSDGPVYHSQILDSTAHSSTMAISRIPQSKSSGDPVYCSSSPLSATKSNSPTHQSKSLDSSVYHSTIPDDPSHSPAHCSKVSFSSSYSMIPDHPTHHSAPVTQERSIYASACEAHFSSKQKGTEDGKPHEHVAADPDRGNPRQTHDLSGYMTIPPPKSKQRHRVHYSDVVDTITYQREEYDSDSSVYASSKDRQQRQRSHKPLHQRGRPDTSGDRLRREVLLRSQRASDRQPPGQYLGGKTVVRTRAPVSSGIEIDVEYGTEDDDEAVPYDPAGVVVEQMSSEWWVEGGSPNVFQALRPKREHLPFETEAANLPPGHSSRRAGPGIGGRGPTGGGDLVAWRQDYHTPSPRAKLDCKARTYSTESRNTREAVSHRGPPLTSKPAKTTRAEAQRLKDGVRLASPECAEPEGPPSGEDGARIFVALFSYDPAVMSPNPETAEEELPFTEGQIIKVYGDKDRDGFYRGETGGHFGYVPGNMVSEIQVDDAVARAQLFQKGFLSPEPCIDDKDPIKPASQALQPVPRRMVAIFDYDPRESSPNADVEDELSFSAGDVIYVLGDMDEDGFFYGDVKGCRGLVPSNFLQAQPFPGEQAPGGPERPQHPPEVPEPRQQPQRQRRKSVIVFDP
ncbi:peripheral-type benzodiazepine receptor-associated protein 1-like [Conger conger]|uniref:peripheral-type benzodiazepine receptor-associated protein 1-like n=1 Tax=Conger conger TaxID=82655 RepID=UPI002A59AD1C|nr:peripheral-type benzodiazepine receptor-associated protein 1-like [Conger conger]